MATQLLGTNANNSLVAIRYASSISAADFATIMQGIKDDLVGANGAHPILPEGLSRFGRLTIPNRGTINVLPGDVVAIDNNGWPILVSAASIAYGGSGLWTFT